MKKKKLITIDEMIARDRPKPILAEIYAKIAELISYHSLAIYKQPKPKFLTGGIVQQNNISQGDYLEFSKLGPEKIIPCNCRCVPIEEKPKTKKLLKKWLKESKLTKGDLNGKLERS